MRLPKTRGMLRREASNWLARLEGGVYLNCGSAVVLPEVFLKAVALADSPAGDAAASPSTSG